MFSKLSNIRCNIQSIRNYTTRLYKGKLINGKLIVLATQKGKLKRGCRKGYCTIHKKGSLQITVFELRFEGIYNTAVSLHGMHSSNGSENELRD